MRVPERPLQIRLHKCVFKNSPMLTPRIRLPTCCASGAGTGQCGGFVDAQNGVGALVVDGILKEDWNALRPGLCPGCLIPGRGTDGRRIAEKYAEREVGD